MKSRYPLSVLSPSLLSILIIVVSTTIAISIVGSNLVIFSEGQKTASTNTHDTNNTSSNLIKWHIINASKGSTSITPAKSSNKMTISEGHSNVAKWLSDGTTYKSHGKPIDIHEAKDVLKLNIEEAIQWGQTLKNL